MVPLYIISCLAHDNASSYHYERLLKAVYLPSVLDEFFWDSKAHNYHLSSLP